MRSTSWSGCCARNSITYRRRAGPDRRTEPARARFGQSARRRRRPHLALGARHGAAPAGARRRRSAAPQPLYRRHCRLVRRIVRPLLRTARLVENLQMRSNGFGRRVVEAGGRELVPVDQPFEGVVHLPDSRARTEHKERVRNILLTRIDSSAVSRLPRPALRPEIAKLVHEIATSERLHLNEIEENAFATELTDDLIGLGPLEPLLDDEDVTDILVNGPYDVFVERLGKLEKTAARFRDVQHVVNVAQRIAAAVG